MAKSFQCLISLYFCLLSMEMYGHHVEYFCTSVSVPFQLMFLQWCLRLCTSYIARHKYKPTCIFVIDFIIAILVTELHTDNLPSPFLRYSVVQTFAHTFKPLKPPLRAFSGIVSERKHLTLFSPIEPHVKIDPQRFNDKTSQENHVVSTMTVA